MLGRRSAGLWQRLLFFVAAITISFSVLAIRHRASAAKRCHLRHDDLQT